MMFGFGRARAIRAGLVCFTLVTHADRTAAEPDAILGGLPATMNWTGSGAIDGLRAYSVARTICNEGTTPLNWFQGPDTRHPVTVPNLYRLKSGRFEQIGQGWVMHHFCALQQTLCGSCSPQCGGCCSTLGAGCSTVNSVTNTGQFTHLGPRSEINIHLGTNPGTHVLPEGNATLRGRVIVREDDLAPSLNPGALYFAEAQFIAEDDAQAGDMSGDNNNASYRRVTVVPFNFNLSFASATRREFAAIHAWEANDPDVTTRNVDIPDEGRLILAYNVTDNGDGTWHYEYALRNLNSDRSVGAFSVQVPDDVTVSEIGFHDVDYHSGEVYSLDDWPAVDHDESVTWATESFERNENANALRWGTLYNFRFDANTPPQPADITLGLFKPGTPDAATVSAMGPSEACPAPAVVPGVASLSFSDRAFDGFIDARAESTDGVNADLGLDTFTIAFNTPLANVDGSPLDASAFSISDTGGTAPSIASATTENGRIVTLALSDRIALQQWTTITVNARAQCSPQSLLSDSIDIGFLPADIDQSGTVDPFDLLTFRQFVNGVSAPIPGVTMDFIDTDRDGQVLPFDLLAFRALINGVAPATRAWSGEILPPRP